jgi:hypothetical protein
LATAEAVALSPWLLRLLLTGPGGGNIASVALRSEITPLFERGRLERALVFFESLLRMKSITGSCFLAPPTRCMEVMMKIKGAKHTRNFARKRDNRWQDDDRVYALQSLLCKEAILPLF